MRSIYTPVVRGLRGHLLRTSIATLCAVLAASHAFAQEGAAAAAADAPSAGGKPGDGATLKGGSEGAAATNRDIDLVAPRRGIAGLWRRANVKTLIANASSTAPGLAAANTRISPPPLRPGIGVSASRNAIGVALPGARPMGHDFAGVTAGTRLSGTGTAAGNVGTQTTQIRTPANAGPALHGAAINGTTMSRMATGPSSIGGPARDHAGINGTLMRPKH
jgi:hypothetical protein